MNRLEMSIKSPSRGRQSFVPGDAVEGEINLHRPFHATGVEASISFVGSSSVRFKEKGRLFAHVLVHEDKFALSHENDLACMRHPNHFVWAFRILIPENVRTVSTSENGRFINAPGGALPPSLLSHKKVENTGFAIVDDPDYQAKVMYTLEATLKKPVFTHSYAGPTFCRMEISLSPLRQHASTHPSRSELVSTHPLSHDIWSASLRRPIASLPSFWSHTNPFLDIRVSAPASVIAGQDLDIRIRLYHNIVQLAAEEPLLVILPSLAIRVQSQTYVRATRLGREFQGKWEDPSLYCCLSVDRVPVALRSIMLAQFETQYWDVSSLIPDVRIKSVDDVPTFKASNISRTYVLNIQGELRLATEIMRFDLTNSLIVLPECCQDGELPGYSRTGDDIPLAEDDAPPPYSEH